MPADVQIYHFIKEPRNLFEKVDSVISRFGSRDPEIAPRSLCRAFFLLEFLDRYTIYVHPNGTHLRDLQNLLQKCWTLIAAQDPVEGSLLYTWPAKAESDLAGLLGNIDRELVCLEYYIPGDPRLPMWLERNFESPSASALNRASITRRRERRDSIEKEPLFIEIKLCKSLNDQSPPIYQLQEVNIADKDDVSRVLQFRNPAAHLVISHRIMKGRFPYTENHPQPTRASFKEPQMIIVKDSQSHRISSSFPKYKFAFANHLELFISTVRERELLGQYLPEMIHQGDIHDHLAKNKIVRVWMRTEVTGQRTVTITFENKHDNGEQRDWDLGDYRYPVDKTKKGNGIEIMTFGPHVQRIIFVFTKGDNSAEKLQSLLNEYHPHSIYRPPRINQDIGSNTPGSWAPNQRLPLDGAASDHGSSTSRVTWSSAWRTDTSGSSTSSMRPPIIIPEARISHEPESTSEPSPISMFGSSHAIPQQRSRFAGQKVPRSRLDFQVAILCALPLEVDAIIAAFDKEWPDTFSRIHGDTNTYSFGCMAGFNVVLVHLADMGVIAAAEASVNCRLSFKGIKISLVVGVCGGIPQLPDGTDVVLGDVIISLGLVPFDTGKQYPEGYRRNENKYDPHYSIRPRLRKLQTEREREKLKMAAVEQLRKIQQMLQKARYPSSDEDKVFHSSYRHRHRNTECEVCNGGPDSPSRVCERALRKSCTELGCDEAQVIRRIPNDVERLPDVHFGRYASGSTVMKSAEQRDQIAGDENLIAFEMEGVGVWERFSTRCLVIKGVCDYADSHKSKRFQNYAASTAAAFTKAFLATWSNSGDDIDTL